MDKQDFTKEQLEVLKNLAEALAPKESKADFSYKELYFQNKENSEKLSKILNKFESLSNAISNNNQRINELQHIIRGYQQALMVAYADHESSLKISNELLIDKLADIETRQANADSLINKLSNSLILTGATKLQDVDIKITPRETLGDVFDVSELGKHMPNEDIVGISQIKIESEPNQSDMPKDLYSRTLDMVIQQAEHLLPLTTPMLNPEMLDRINEAVKEIKPVETPKLKRKKLGLKFQSYNSLLSEITETLKKKNQSQRQLSLAAGWSNTYLNNVINGKAGKKPSIDQLTVLLDFANKLEQRP